MRKVKMVSQGAQTNGMNGNKKLTKSYSEMGTADAGCQYEDGWVFCNVKKVHIYILIYY